MSKKITSWILTAVLCTAFTTFSKAEPLSGFDPGIENILNYQEVVFVTGKPVILKGTVKGPKKDADKTKSPRKESYSYTLTGDKASLKRTVNMTTEIEIQGDQQIERTTITSYKETLAIDGKTYTADNKTSQFTQTMIHQKKPAVDYFSGNMSYLKKYTPSGKGADGKDAIIVSMEGSTVGYGQKWGSTETRTMNYSIATENPSEGKGINGNYSVKSSNNITKDIEYMANQPTQISFRGGYMISMKEESVLQYDYDMNGYRGGNSFTLANNPVFERLYVPAYKDISGHWAEKSIGLIASMNAVKRDTEYFSPSTQMSREEFARAVSVVSGIEPPPMPKTTAKKNQPELIFADVKAEPAPTTKTTTKKTPPEPVATDYIKGVKNQGVMSGVGENRFDPDAPLTKAQAATILINALGFNALAPNGNYATGYADDSSIPFWAKDSVYMAKEIGLMTGSENNYFQPDKPLTRAEAAAILDAYIKYMTYELREEYRERIMNY